MSQYFHDQGMIFNRFQEPKKVSGQGQGQGQKQGQTQGHCQGQGVDLRSLMCITDLRPLCQQGAGRALWQLHDSVRFKGVFIGNKKLETPGGLHPSFRHSCKWLTALGLTAELFAMWPFISY